LGLEALDVKAFYLINHLRADWLGWFLGLCSEPKFIYLFFALTGLLIAKRFGIKRFCLIYLFLFLGFLWVDFTVARILKPLFKRPRPFVSIGDVYLGGAHAKYLVTPLVKKVSYSFPSAHASNVGFASFYLSLWYKKAAWLWLCFAFLVGWSRVYLGVHYPFDVLMGWCYGGLWALIIHNLSKKLVSRI